MVNISQAAQACGLSNKTIRFYEELGLVVPIRHETNDYRVYSLANIEQLRFLQRARAVGFGLGECRELLGLYLDPLRRDQQVKQELDLKIRQIDQQFIALNAIRSSLQTMVDQCVTASEVVDGNMLARPEKSPLAMAFTLIDSGAD